MPCQMMAWAGQNPDGIPNHGWASLPGPHNPGRWCSSRPFFPKERAGMAQTRARTGPSAPGEEEGEKSFLGKRGGMRTLSFLEVSPGFALDGNRTHNHPVKGG